MELTAIKSEQDKSLLIVDDDERFRERLAQAFRHRGYCVETAEGGAVASQKGRQQRFDAAIVDLCMPDCNGLALIQELRVLQPGLRILILTGYGSIGTAKEALRQGAVDYLTKPAGAEEIEQALFMERENSELVIPSHVSIPSLERVEWEHIQRVLTDVQGNVSEAARRLGIERRTLQRKLRKYPPAR